MLELGGIYTPSSKVHQKTESQGDINVTVSRLNVPEDMRKKVEEQEQKHKALMSADEKSFPRDG
ncbi:hypothetical protein ACFL4Z_00585 [candidate division KSB1 bacterium]